MAVYPAPGPSRITLGSWMQLDRGVGGTCYPVGIANCWDLVNKQFAMENGHSYLENITIVIGKHN